MQDGVYQAEYYGPFGSGSAAFTLCNGQIIGADIGGGQYGGRITFNPASSKWLLKLNLRAPAGVSLVTDGRIRSADELIPVELELTENDLGKPLPLNTPTGPVTVTITRSQ